MAFTASPEIVDYRPWPERIAATGSGLKPSLTANTMPESLEQILISVWRQVLLEDSKTVKVDGRSFPVQRTRRSKLREVDFEFEGQRLRGLEQNPKTNSRWAQLAREGKKVMQFLSSGRYIASVADGQLLLYARGQLA